MDIKHARSAPVMMAAAAILITLGISLGACGSGSKGVPSVATSSGTGTSGRSTGTTASAQTDEEKVRAFVQAMRDRGIPLEDPVVDTNGIIQKPGLEEGAEVSKEEVEAAWDECSHLLEGFTFGYSGDDLVALADKYVDLAKRLREKGFDVNDPTPDNLKLWALDTSTKIDWSDPVAAAVYKEWGGESVDIIGLTDMGKKQTDTQGSGAPGGQGQKQAEKGQQ